VLWAAAHEDTGNEALVKELQKDKQGFIAAVLQRWAASALAAEKATVPSD
jgi:hypothetical protein